MGDDNYWNQPTQLFLVINAGGGQIDPQFAAEPVIDRPLGEVARFLRTVRTDELWRYSIGQEGRARWLPERIFRLATRTDIPDD